MVQIGRKGSFVTKVTQLVRYLIHSIGPFVVPKNKKSVTLFSPLGASPPCAFSTGYVPPTSFGEP